MEPVDQPQSPAKSPKKSWELFGWFMYDAANGAFFYGASAYFPALVTSQAKSMAKEAFCGACLDNEWATDYENEGKCSNEDLMTFAACTDAGDEWNADISKEASNVAFLGGEVGYASVFSFCTTISVVLQLFFFLTMGSFADYGPNRKAMMFVFNQIGVVCLLLVIFFKKDSDYLLNASMYIISTVCWPVEGSMDHHMTCPITDCLNRTFSSCILVLRTNARKGLFLSFVDAVISIMLRCEDTIIRMILLR